MTTISETWYSVDLHGDILLDVLERRRNGNGRSSNPITSQRCAPPCPRAGSPDLHLVRVPSGALRQAMLMVDALYQEVGESSEHLVLVHTRADLERALREDKTGLILAFEGADPLGRNWSQNLGDALCGGERVGQNI